VGFAGVRLHYPLNRPDYYDEVCAFLGASYFRAVAKGQGYGLSARGLAIKTADASGEEFPLFKTFWLERPAPGEPGKNRVDLFGEGAAWRRAELDLELVADAAALRAFERRHGAPAAVVVARCGATRGRRSARLVRSGRSRSRWAGTFELDRDNYRGRALLRARLAAAGGDAPRLVAEAEPYEVYVDEPAGLDFGGGLRLRWRDFRAADADPLARQFADATHVVAFGAGGTREEDEDVDGH